MSCPGQQLVQGCRQCAGWGQNLRHNLLNLEDRVLKACPHWRL